ncbi:hypothetical protein [Celerinatantimonas sp. MCCC 1A17872]|uniref:hypothetical protein n=1 Tax=Celerinatantimonas sp. MCCC 1A17872 TaxID=3177514 RepID=UPI0038C2CD23
MKKEKLIKLFDKAISDLEDSGEIVVTTTTYGKVSEYLYEVVRDELCDEYNQTSEALQLPELRIESTLSKSISQLHKVFDLSLDNAENLAYEFYAYCRHTRTELEIADYFSHEGPLEVALTAYYCCQLGKNRFGNSNYLKWRQEIYAKLFG